MTVEDELAEGDKAVARWVSSGTHRGDCYGLAPTRRHFATSGIDIFATEGGKIREVWVVVDSLGMMQQLGAIPGPSAATT
jgi:predicted ester cyclase